MAVIFIGTGVVLFFVSMFLIFSPEKKPELEPEEEQDITPDDELTDEEKARLDKLVDMWANMSIEEKVDCVHKMGLEREVENAIKQLQEKDKENLE